jgi:hypothetical protein
MNHEARLRGPQQILHIKFLETLPEASDGDTVSSAISLEASDDLTHWLCMWPSCCPPVWWLVLLATARRDSSGSVSDLCRGAQVKHLLRAVVPRHVLWGTQSGAVFDALRADFMTDVVSVVDELLAEGAHKLAKNLIARIST